MLDVNERLMAYMSSRELIFKRSHLYVEDTKKIAMSAMKNPYYRRLVDNCNQGIIKLSSASLPNYKTCTISDLPASSMHFASDEYDTFGYFLASISSWEKLVRSVSSKLEFFVHHHPKFNTFEGWGFLSQTGIPANAAIISDRYLLGNPSTYERNLVEIVTNIIPANFSETFHLSIISDKRELRNPEVTYKDIKKALNKLKVNISLGLFLPNKQCPHDRFIITNYYELHSGDSLDYYNTDGRLRRTLKTKLSFTPLNTSKSSYFNLLEDFKYVMSNSRVIGDASNRLVRDF